jgi:hypothetical protein
MMVHTRKVPIALIAMIGSGFSLLVSGQTSAGNPQSVVGTVINLEQQRTNNSG